MLDMQLLSQVIAPPNKSLTLKRSNTRAERLGLGIIEANRKVNTTVKTMVLLIELFRVTFFSIWTAAVERA